MRVQRLAAVTRKEFLHVIRDWRSLFLSLATPMILVLLFGYALTLDLKNVPTVVWDQSQSMESRELLSLFSGSSYFSMNGYHDSYKALQLALDRGSAMVAIVVPRDFAEKIISREKVAIQIIGDGSDANTSRLAMGYAKAIGMIYSNAVTAENMRISGRTNLVRPVEMVNRSWYNPDLRSQNVIIPGIIAIVMVVIAAMLTSVTIAREWETGTMEQLISTPLNGPELIFGKIIPYFVIGMVDVAIAVSMGKWLFHVPIVGNAGLLFGLAAVFLIGALFWGMTLSIVLKSQVLANQIALLSSFMPSIMLSGFMFAIEDMPSLIRQLSYILPARYLIAILRGIYLKGIGLEILWLNAALLTLYMIIMVVLAHRKMRLTLE